MSTIQPTAPDWTNLADTTITFRERHGITQAEVATRGGPSVPTLRRIERGQPVGPDTLKSLDTGLGWPPGTAEAITRREPVTLPDPEEDLRVGFLPGLARLDPLARARVIAAARKAALDQLAELDPITDR